MASPTQWTWVWASSRRWWWTGKPGVLQSIGWQRVRHDWDWTETLSGLTNSLVFFYVIQSLPGSRTIYPCAYLSSIYLYSLYVYLHLIYIPIYLNYKNCLMCLWRLRSATIVCLQVEELGNLVVSFSLCLKIWESCCWWCNHSLNWEHNVWEQEEMDVSGQAERAK